MRNKKAGAMALVMMMTMLSFSWLVSASEETVVVPITPIGEKTPDGGTVDGYAIYFADNMAFTPQWRIGNYVRIEVMVLKVWDYNGNGTIEDDDVPVTVNTNITSGVVGDQASYIANPSDLLWTWMVSVPEITIEMKNANGVTVDSFHSYFGDLVADPEDTVGREINKAGHLIYGFLWDTTGLEAGVYTVLVTVPGYPVLMAVRSLVVAEDAEPIGYEVLPANTGLSGTGGVIGPSTAFINLGQLIPKGGSGTNGGNGGNGGGNGYLGGRH